MRVIDGRQVTAARALVGMSVAELAIAAQVTPRTVARIEIGGAISIWTKRRHGHVAKSTFDKIEAALHHRGVELVPETEHQGAGARWTLPRDQR